MLGNLVDAPGIKPAAGIQQGKVKRLKLVRSLKPRGPGRLGGFARALGAALENGKILQDQPDLARVLGQRLFQPFRRQLAIGAVVVEKLHQHERRILGPDDRIAPVVIERIAGLGQGLGPLLVCLRLALGLQGIKGLFHHFRLFQKRGADLRPVKLRAGAGPRSHIARKAA